MNENKIEVIEAIENMCRTTSVLRDLIIEPGYRDMDGKFIPSTERIEWLCFRWHNQDRRFGIYQSIEADSGYGIIIDAMKVISRLG